MLRKTYLHSGWVFGETGKVGTQIGVIRLPWLPAQVPGHVHLDLVQNGVIADPFERMNEIGCQWVDQADWTYKTEFDFVPDPALPKRVLRFDGLDSVATIELNDEEVGAIDNMFVPIEIDVTEKLKEGKNTLSVHFKSAVKLGLERQEKYFADQGLDLEKVGRFGDRSFVRKAQYMYGWDWGPRLVSCGIWKPVSLIEYAARLTDVHVTQKFNQDGSVTLTTTAEFEGDAEFYYVDVLFPDMETLDGPLYDVNGANCIVKEPELWTPLETDPPLYTVSVNLMRPVGETEEGTEYEHVDQQIVKIGIKSVELVREPDEFGESYEFKVNGKPLWVRGANWIPDHSFPSVISKQRYREQIERCKDMGFNMLRVWGGGIYEADAFYEACDEVGILVWQDFPFACGFYPDDQEFVEPFKKEATANIKRLRNHASLGMWCGNNENQQCFAQRWMGDKTPPRFYGEHFYNEVIPTLLAELDPAKPYTPGSAVGAKATPLEKVNDGGVGDSHYWDVWHGRGDWRFYTDSTARFSSEFGFCSAAALSTWDKYLGEDDWAAHSEAVMWHDKTGKGDEKFHSYVELHYPVSESLEDWVYYSQLNQRDALRFGIEHFRRSEFCKGTLIWQVNDCWPVSSWAFVDCEGNYKPLAYECRRIYADQLISLKRDGDKMAVWGINDGENTWPLELSVKAYSTLTGEVLRTWEADPEIDAHSRSEVLVCDLNGLNVHETILVASGDGVEEAWQFLGEPKDQRLAPPSKITVSTYEDGAILVKTTEPVFDLVLTENGSTIGLLDNVLTGPEPGVYVLAVEKTPTTLEARSLAGDHPVVITRSPI